MNNRWVKKRLGDVVTRLTNGYVGPTRGIYLESGVPYLLARHVKNNLLAFDGKTFISAEFNQKIKKSMLNAGDVLLVQSGHIGHSAVVTEEHVGHNCHAMVKAHLRRERSGFLAAQCKERDAYRCQVCGFRFEDLYGERGLGFAEAHHLVPLSRLRDEVKTRLEDLITVCANCHRMLHRMEGKRDDMKKLGAFIRKRQGKRHEP